MKASKVAGLAVAAGLALAPAAPASAVTVKASAHPVHVTVFYRTGLILKADCKRHQRTAHGHGFISCINIRRSHGHALGAATRSNVFVIAKQSGGNINGRCHLVTSSGAAGHMTWVMHNAVMGT